MSHIPKRIFIDPGHGGHDPGALNEETGLKEKDVTLSVAHKLADYLRKFDVYTALSRANDLYLGLAQRAKKCNEMKADAFISIHCNSAQAPLAKGFEVFSTPGVTNSDRLATLAFDEFGQEFPNNVPRPDREDGDPDKEASFSVIRRANCPAILFELEFIHNRSGAAFLVSQQTRMAQALGRALVKFLSLKPKDGSGDPIELTPTEDLRKKYEDTRKELESFTAKYKALVRDLAELKDDYSI